MNQLNDGDRFMTDPFECRRIAFLVEETDVGTTQPMYLGQMDYTFEPKDVGRLLEVVLDYSPGFMSWGFGSKFSELRKQYPNPFPYAKVD